jgi:NAD(P)-dependent dehydrogenase (short-subunit alcohol dehydrogenase family)
MCHCESVASGLLDTSIESFNRHFAVNARATWLLIREYGHRFHSEPWTGRIIGLTSDHTAGNLPYGASKGALDRIILAAARELAHLGRPDLQVQRSASCPSTAGLGLEGSYGSSRVWAASRPLVRAGGVLAALGGHGA